MPKTRSNTRRTTSAKKDSKHVQTQVQTEDSCASLSSDKTLLHGLRGLASVAELVLSRMKAMGRATIARQEQVGIAALAAQAYLDASISDRLHASFSEKAYARIQSEMDAFYSDLRTTAERSMCDCDVHVGDLEAGVKAVYAFCSEASDIMTKSVALGSDASSYATLLIDRLVKAVYVAQEFEDSRTEASSIEFFDTADRRQHAMPVHSSMGVFRMIKPSERR